MATDKKPVIVEAYFRRNPYIFNGEDAQWHIDFHGKYDSWEDPAGYCPIEMRLYVYVKDGHIDLHLSRPTAVAVSGGQTVEQMTQAAKWLKAVEKRLENFTKQFGSTDNVGEKLCRVLNAVQAEQVSVRIMDNSVRETFGFNPDFMRHDKHGNLLEAMYELGNMRFFVNNLDWKYQHVIEERAKKDQARFEATKALPEPAFELETGASEIAYVESK